MQVCVMGTGEYARSRPAVKNFVTGVAFFVSFASGLEACSYECYSLIKAQTARTFA
jgi:hypothetical protein